MGAGEGSGSRALGPGSDRDDSLRAELDGSGLQDRDRARRLEPGRIFVLVVAVNVELFVGEGVLEDSRDPFELGQVLAVALLNQNQ